MEDFRAHLERRLASYFQMEDQLGKRIGDLSEELAAVRRRADAAQQLYQAEYGEPYDRGRAKRRPPDTRSVAGPLSDLSWFEAIARVISDAGRPLHVKEIWQALQTGGFATHSSDPERSIVSICVRNPDRLMKTAPATYTVTGFDDGRRPLWWAAATPSEEE
jgi:hypothetical protein